MSADPFGTDARREALLQAWSASPTRFREDANAEEDLVLGGYADRLLIELAQNAADAATRAGVEGHLRFTLADDGVLVAANTGAPLDAAGVDALTSLRASSKRDSSTVGRFGVGFAAVLGVSTEPEIRSRNGGIRFSATKTRELVSELGGAPAAEAERRGGQVPVLRLAWPVDAAPSDGFDTEVRLPLVERAAKVVAEALASFDSAVLLGMSGLSRLDLDGRVIERSTVDDDHVVLVDNGQSTRWRCVRHDGVLAPELLADRPVEERERAQWNVLVAVPVEADDQPEPLSGQQVVHAPTPTDELLSLPVHLAASFPLETSRRRVVGSKVTDFLVERAADAVLELAESLPAEPAVLRLVPRPTLAKSELDAALGSAVLARLRTARLFAPEADESVRIIGSRAATLEPQLADVTPLLSDVIAGLLPADYSADRSLRIALDALDVARVSLGGVIDAAASVSREPSWWREFYAALSEAAVGHTDADALAALPVPLTDGRTVTGPRGLLLATDELPEEAVETLGLRIVHPDAAHPLLERLGAQRAGAAAVLADPRVRAEVEHSLDAEDPEAIADAVLALVDATGLSAVDEPWLEQLALPDDEDEFSPAAELMVPGSPLADMMSASESPFGVVSADFADRWGLRVLSAVGCLSTFTVLDIDDVDLFDVDQLSLVGISEWADEVVDLVDAEVGVRIERLQAIRDLEFVTSWDAAVSLLGVEPLRSVLGAPTYVIAPDGNRTEVPSYTRWWLSRQPILAGRRPVDLRVGGAAALEGLFDLAEGEPELLALLGCRTSFADILDSVRVDPDAAEELLDRLADKSRTVTAVLLREVYPRLAEALADVEIAPPALIRVAPDKVVPAEQVTVLDAPWLVSKLGKRFAVPGGSDPEAVADLLDVPLLSEVE